MCFATGGNGSEISAFLQKQRFLFADGGTKTFSKQTNPISLLAEIICYQAN